MKRAFKIELVPTKPQHQELRSMMGFRRAMYNSGVSAARTGSYNKNIIRSIVRSKKNFYSYFCLHSAAIMDEALTDLDKSFGSFFKGQSGYPGFKSKRDFDGSFRIRDRRKFKVLDGNKLRLEKFKSGQIRLKEGLPLDFYPSSITVIQEAGKYYASFLYEKETLDVDLTDDVIGVDMGLTHLAITCDGQKFKNIRTTSTYGYKLRRAQRLLKRKKKGSNRRRKQLLKVRKVNARIKRVRSNHLHIVSKTIVDKLPKMIVLEDLNIKGMVKNKRLSKAISDAGWYTLKLMIRYKAEERGIQVIDADRFYPSSQITPSGDIQKLSLSERFGLDNKTGLWYDRDVNAAKNLADYGRQRLASE